MKVFVKNQYNKPLMPTTPRKARILLKSGKAEVVQRLPFTIKLLYPTGNATQDITLGIDTGFLNIGFSAVSDKEELISGEVKLLGGMPGRNEERAMYRRNRRGRLWHRKPGFDVNTNREGWLAPSIKHKLDSHIRFINKITDILPITKIVIEVANFDIQKIKNPDIKGRQYQEGEQKGYENLRAYILHRDNYRCQNPDCKNKQAQPELHVHHIQYRINGGPDRPDNLITLCSKCHTPKNHKGFLLTWKQKVRGFKDATFMNTVKWKLVEILKENHAVDVTYGYLTKEKRQAMELEKTHANDAFCIANGMNQVRHNPYEIRQIRRNNRSLSTFHDAKYIDSRDKSLKTGTELYSGRTTRNKQLNTENLRKYRQQRITKGKLVIRKNHYPVQPMDLVNYNGNLYYVMGTHSYGKRVILKDQIKKSGISVNSLKVEIIKHGKGFCWVDTSIPC
ncbi:Paclitaxel/taxanoid biosynthesis susceptibility protein TS1 [Methanosarcina lacustris Z-7289]|uniref:Paclitaxel/taxanoid biosynthesis susceptibility protein TS1 n=1 Tax=Methanosarcina lacustris Z-7289 TaxID=1434111 RepID=A0A0E3S744_9EURY|nr:RNA-guided endonuclease IscB [Methanosarcina lacustris]AKB76326.1 Paclitaxel/taxanoid biosynthesis susceptibility protein TS1 [Methanosarcina lacustris Z-7289]